MTCRNGRRATSPEGVNRFKQGPFDTDLYNKTVGEPPTNLPPLNQDGAQQLASNAADDSPRKQMT